MPASWVEEATTFKIDNAPGMSQERKDSSDWRQGYCYQFWRSRHNSFRGDGAFGQYCLVLPEEDAVIAITSETTDMQGELNLVWEFLLPAMQVDKSTLNKNDAAILKKRLASLKLRLLPTDISFSAPTISGKNFVMESNPQKIERVSFSDKNHIITLTLKTAFDSYIFNFGDGKWIEGKTNMLGPSLVAAAKNHFAGLGASQIAGAYRWTGNSTLQTQLRYIDSPHTEIMTFHFDQNKISVDLQDSFKTPDKKITLNGEKIN